MNYYSINVLIIAYKQEKLIGRALESILVQKQYGLSKIVVCDDCSPDNTWDVLKKYSKEYPEIIEVYRSEPNKGIYGNAWEVTCKRGDADFYYMMAGDDALCDGWFKAVQQFLSGKVIKPCEQSICIFSDWKLVTPGNVERVYKQDLVTKRSVDALSLRIRGLICGRSMLQSNALIAQQTPVDLANGVSKAEKFFEFQPVMHAKHVLYCPYVGSMYFSGIGISTTAHSVEYRKGIIEANRCFLDTFKLKKKDANHIRYKMAYQEFQLSHSFLWYCKMLWFYMISIDTNIGFSIKQLIKLVLAR